LPDDKGQKFKGNYTLVKDPDVTGYVDCELFENKVAYFMQGTWHEQINEVIEVFTWFAKGKK
jgi:hypothetical protein